MYGNFIAVVVFIEFKSRFLEAGVHKNVLQVGLYGLWAQFRLENVWYGGRGVLGNKTLLTDAKRV